MIPIQLVSSDQVMIGRMFPLVLQCIWIPIVEQKEKLLDSWLNALARPLVDATTCQRSVNEMALVNDYVLARVKLLGKFCRTWPENELNSEFINIDMLITAGSTCQVKTAVVSLVPGPQLARPAPFSNPMICGVGGRSPSAAKASAAAMHPISYRR